MLVTVRKEMVGTRRLELLTSTVSTVRVLYLEQLVTTRPNRQALPNTCKTARLRAGIRAGNFL